MSRYTDLRKSYQDIKAYFDSDMLPEVLIPLKKTIDEFEFPKKTDKDLWFRLKELHSIFDIVLPIIQSYVQKNDHGGPLDEILMNCKVLEQLIERYQQDILIDFFNICIDEENYKQLENLYTKYIVPMKMDDVKVTVAVAKEMFKPEFRCEYGIDGQTARKIIGGAIFKLQASDEDTEGASADIIGHLSEL